MSRIGKVPIKIPEKVTVTFKGDEIEVKGPKGLIVLGNSDLIEYEQEGDTIYVKRKNDSRKAREQHGLRRTLLANAVEGVTKGFEKGLEIVGVGYRAEVKGKTLVINVGYSNPKEYQLPEGITARVEGNKIFITGIDKQLVGEVAAQIRRIRPPEPYKGKGIKYINEQILRKAGKSAKA
ncbi:50S ribosomal protein L6 [Desulfothermus okinawensis JCM 13304]